MRAQDSPIGPVIAEWRELKNRISGSLAEKAKLEASLSDLKNELSALQNQWDEQQSSSKQTMLTVEAHISAKTAELSRVENDTQELSAKVQERRKKIMDDSRLIRSREDAADKKLKDITELENASRARLIDFREARDAAMSKINQHISKLEAALPAEANEHARRIAALEAQRRETEQCIDQENAVWEIECARREFRTQSEAMIRLREECEAVSHAKCEWSELIGVISAQSGKSAGMQQELSQLREELKRSEN